MYKSHFAHHGMHKYNKASDMAFVIRKMRTRDAQGKRSSFVVGERVVSAEETERYMRRKRGRDLEFEEAPADAPTPTHIQCYSLPSSPSPEGVQDNLMIQGENMTSPRDMIIAPDRRRKRKRSMSWTMEIHNGVVRQRAYPCAPGRARSPGVPINVTTPQTFSEYELLFTNISNYVGGSIGSGTWFISDDGYLETTTQTGPSGCSVFQDLFFCAVQHLKRFQFTEGRLLASKAISLLPAMLLEESPMLLADLLDTFLLCSRFGFVGFCAMLQDHIIRLAELILPERQIWRQICISLCAQDPDHTEVMRRSWRCLSDSFIRSTGRFSNISVICEADLIRATYYNDLSRGVQLLEQLLSDYRQTTETLDDTELHILERLVYHLLHQRNYVEAEALLENYSLSARQSPEPWHRWEEVLRGHFAEVGISWAKIGVAKQIMRNASALFPDLH